MEPFETPFPLDSDALEDCVRKLTAEYPFLQVSTVGHSILSKPLPVLIFGNGKKEYLYVGAHHGMEWMTSIFLLRFAKELCDGYQKGRTIYKTSCAELWKQCKIHILPMLNPDGVNYQIHGILQENPLYSRVIGMNGGSSNLSCWQANARGVDLNHNYDDAFDVYKKMEKEMSIPCGAPTKFSGQEPESEPEVRGLCSYIRFHHPLRAVISLHTQGEEIYWKSREKSIPGSESMARRVASLCGYRLAESEGTASFGGLTDWCIRKLDVKALTLECGKGRNPLPKSEEYPTYLRLREALFSIPKIY